MTKHEVMQEFLAKVPAVAHLYLDDMRERSQRSIATDDISNPLYTHPKTVGDLEHDITTLLVKTLRRMFETRGVAATHAEIAELYMDNIGIITDKIKQTFAVRLAQYNAEKRAAALKRAEQARAFYDAPKNRPRYTAE